MGRDKSKDDKLFNCSQEYEYDYVSGLYSDSQIVYDFLQEKCADKTIYHSTHDEVYKLIEDELGYSIPV